MGEDRSEKAPHSKTAQRNARRAAALRANLARRKAQARARAAKDEAPAAPEDEAGGLRD